MWIFLEINLYFDKVDIYKLEKHKQGFWYLILYGMRKCGVIVFKLMSINIKLPYEGIRYFFLL